jgi:hypothetical protein
MSQVLQRVDLGGGLAVDGEEAGAVEDSMVC